MKMKKSPLRRKITAILAADIAEYTRITAEDEEETLTRLRSYRLVFDDFVARSGGRVFNSAGDSVMCEFQSAVEATRCAIEIQESLRTQNMSFPVNRQMHFRIGITIGDVVERDGDLLGDSVNIAGRLQALAEPGAICVSRNVQEVIANKISLPIVDLGPRDLKNLPYRVHVFQIALNDAVPTSAQEFGVARSRMDGDFQLRRALPHLALAGIATLATGIGLLSWFSASRSSLPDAVSIESKSLERPAIAERTSIVVTESLTPVQAFEKLAKSGGLIRDPASVAELYHNARMQEARGENAAARRDYMALAEHHADHIDPLMRFAALIRAQDGRAGAREVFAGLAQREHRAARVVHSLQFDGNERLRRLADFALANVDYAPAHYLLAVELGEDRQGSQTIDEKRRELAALGEFLAAERAGTLVPFFLDQSVLSDWINRAQKRESLLKAFFAEGRDMVSAEFTRTNAGWLGSITLPESALQLEYRLGATGEFRATGTLQVNDPRTGRPMPRQSFEFPPQSSPIELAFRYTDASGLVSPVTTVIFDPKAALHRGMRQQLERISSSWLSFGADPDSQRVYLATLLAYRCAIEKVEIGFNGQAPRDVIPLPACNPTDPMRVPSGARLAVALHPTVENVTC